MCEQTEVKYLEGDIVWVKLGPCWWPGEVQEFDKMPPDIVRAFKKPPLAVVKFFQEDSYEYVKNLSNIYKYNCRKKNDFIKKGLDMFRNKNSFMEKFPTDVCRAETLTGGDPNILTDEMFAPEQKPSYSQIFGTPSPKKSPKILNKGRPSTSAQKTTPKSGDKKITHPRFVGKSDYEVTILEQTTPSPKPSSYTCCYCGFQSARLNVIVLHNKSHSSGFYTPEKQKLKGKSALHKRSKKSARTTFAHTTSIDEDISLIRQGLMLSTSDSSDEEPDKERSKGGVKRKVNRKGANTNKKSKTTTSTICSNLLADWGDSDSTNESDVNNQSLTDTVDKNKKSETNTIHNQLLADWEEKSEEEVGVNKQIKKTVVETKTKADSNENGNVSCFDFAEEEEHTVLEKSPGRKIPRVIPQKRKSSDISDFEYRTEAEMELKRKEIRSSSLTNIKEDRAGNTEVDETAFKNILAETSVPEMPSIDNLKIIKNFQEHRLVKSPDKKSEDNVEKTNGVLKQSSKTQETSESEIFHITHKKRFVRNFEDFEMFHNEQKIAEETSLRQSSGLEVSKLKSQLMSKLTTELPQTVNEEVKVSKIEEEKQKEASVSEPKKVETHEEIVTDQECEKEYDEVNVERIIFNDPIPELGEQPVIVPQDLEMIELRKDSTDEMPKSPIYEDIKKDDSKHEQEYVSSEYIEVSKEEKEEHIETNNVIQSEEVEITNFEKPEFTRENNSLQENQITQENKDINETTLSQHEETQMYPSQQLNFQHEEAVCQDEQKSFESEEIKAANEVDTEEISLAQQVIEQPAQDTVQTQEDSTHYFQMSPVNMQEIETQVEKDYQEESAEQEVQENIQFKNESYEEQAIIEKRGSEIIQDQEEIISEPVTTHSVPQEILVPEEVHIEENISDQQEIQYPIEEINKCDNFPQEEVQGEQISKTSTNEPRDLIEEVPSDFAEEQKMQVEDPQPPKIVVGISDICIDNTDNLSGLTTLAAVSELTGNFDSSNSVSKENEKSVEAPTEQIILEKEVVPTQEESLVEEQIIEEIYISKESHTIDETEMIEEHQRVDSNVPEDLSISQQPMENEKLEESAIMNEIPENEVNPVTETHLLNETTSIIEESSVTNESVIIEKLPLIEELPVTEESQVLEKSVLTEDTQMFEKPPLIEEPQLFVPLVEKHSQVFEEPSVTDEISINDETPVSEKPLTFEESSATEDQETKEETSVDKTFLVIEEMSMTEESPIIEETPLNEASPVIEETLQRENLVMETEEPESAQNASGIEDMLMNETSVTEHPIVEQFPLVEEHPIREQLPLVEEHSITKQLPLVEELPITEQLPIEGEYPITQQLPIVEEHQGTEQLPTVEEHQGTEELPVIEDHPITEEFEEHPNVEEHPILEELPSVEKHPITEEHSIIEEPPVVMEHTMTEKIPVEEEHHIVDLPLVEEHSITEEVCPFVNEHHVEESVLSHEHVIVQNNVIEESPDVSTAVESADVELPDGECVGIETANVALADIKPTDAEPVNVETADVEPVDVESVDVESTDVEHTQVKYATVDECPPVEETHITEGNTVETNILIQEKLPIVEEVSLGKEQETSEKNSEDSVVTEECLSLEHSPLIQVPQVIEETTIAEKPSLLNEDAEGKILNVEDIPLPPKKIQTLANFSMDFSDSNESITMKKDESQEIINEGQQVSPFDNEKSKKYEISENQTEIVSDIKIDGNNETVSMPQNTSQESISTASEFPPFTFVEEGNVVNEPDYVEKIDHAIDSAETSLESEMAKLTDTQPGTEELLREPQNTSSSKLLEILTEPKISSSSKKFIGIPKNVISSSNAKLNMVISGDKGLMRKFDSKTSKLVIKSATTPGKTLTGKTTGKPIILSEKIIKPVGESECVSVKKVTSKRSYQDVEDIDTFIIQKSAKKTNTSDDMQDIILTPKSEATRQLKSASRIRGKPKIIEQTIIKAADVPASAETGPLLDDTMFDINSMPIVLSDQILTPEIIENMPVVMSDLTPVSVSTSAAASSISEKSQQPVTSIKRGGTLQQVKLLNKAKVNTSQAEGTPKIGQAIVKSVIPRGLGKNQKVYHSSSTKLLKSNPAVITQPGKPGKFIILPTTTASNSGGSKYTVGKRLAMKNTATLGAAGSAAAKVKSVQGLPNEPTGNKIMIVTNNQGVQSRVLLTPAQQKMLAGKMPATKISKGQSAQQIKSNLIHPKSILTSKGTLLTPINSGLVTTQKNPSLVTQTIVTTKGQIFASSQGQTLVTSEGQVLTPLTPQQLRNIKAEKGGRKLQTSGSRLILPEKSLETPSKGKILMGGKTKTILIKGPQGQTIKKFTSNTPDSKSIYLSGQKQLVNISGQQLQQAGISGKQVVLNSKGQVIKSDKVSIGKQMGERVNIQRTTKIPIRGSSKTKAQMLLSPGTSSPLTKQTSLSSTISVPPLAPITTSPSRKSENLLQIATEQPSVKLPTVIKETKEKAGGDTVVEQKHLIIQDSMGNQTTVTEGQILALPSEAVDGQPQSYMLVTVDESGNLAPISNETLMSLKPSLALGGGDMNNIVLQFDQPSTAENQVTESKVESIPTDLSTDSQSLRGEIITSEPQVVNIDGQQIILDQTPQIAAEQQIVVNEGQQMFVTGKEGETYVVEERIVGSEPAADTQTVACNISTGETSQQLIITGDPESTQKFLASLSEGNTDLSSLLTGAEGNIIINTDGQQILLNTDPENQILLMPTSGEEDLSQGTMYVTQQAMKNQDILAAALADTDVFQQESASDKLSASQELVKSSNPPQSQLSPNSALYPMNVGNVLETSLTLGSPIMTPLEVPSVSSKKIKHDIETTLMTQVPSSLELPITITDPSISQTVSQQVMLGNDLQPNLDLPISIGDTGITSIRSTEMSSPTFVYSLPTLEDNSDVETKTSFPESSASITVTSENMYNTSLTGSMSMPLLTEEPELSAVTSESSEEVHISSTNETIKSQTEEVKEKPVTSYSIANSTIQHTSVAEMTQKITNELDPIVDELDLQTSDICDSLSEPPPGMFDKSSFTLNESYLASKEPENVSDIPLPPEENTPTEVSASESTVPSEPALTSESKLPSETISPSEPTLHTEPEMISEPISPLDPPASSGSTLPPDLHSPAASDNAEDVNSLPALSEDKNVEIDNNVQIESGANCVTENTVSSNLDMDFETSDQPNSVEEPVNQERPMSDLSNSEVNSPRLDIDESSYEIPVQPTIITNLTESTLASGFNLGEESRKRECDQTDEASDSKRTKLSCD